MKLNLLYEKINTEFTDITSGKIIASGYKNGQLIDLSIKDYATDTENFELAGDIDTVKVMVWDGLNSLTPLTKAEIITEAAFTTK